MIQDVIEREVEKALREDRELWGDFGDPEVVAKIRAEIAADARERVIRDAERAEYRRLRYWRTGRA